MILKFNGSTWKLKDVRHVPNLKKNLVSVGQVCDDDCEVVLTKHNWKVKKGAMVLARGVRVGTLYRTSDGTTLTVSSSGEDTNLWHRILGHMSEKNMKILCSGGYLPKVKSVDMSFCEDCVLGKKKRVSFSRDGRALKSKKLDLVHTDVWGPIDVASHSGFQYYITFIDDHSRKVWLYFMKNKFEVYEVFKKWKALVETETGLKLKCLRSDNGGEYDKTEFLQLCATNGIRLERTVPRTPQENEVAERMNWTLNARARCMRLHSGFPETFWAHATETASYLINRTPSSPLDMKIP